MRRRVLFPAALLLLVVGSGQALSAEREVSVEDDFFDPEGVTIRPNDTVKWRWVGSNHDVKSDPNQAEQFDSDPNTSDAFHPPGFTFARKFTKPGRYRYHCTIHGGPGGAGMSGRVTVNDPDGSPPGPPVLSELKVDPAKFCKVKTDKCPTPGAKIKFKLSQFAKKVTGPVIRRSDNKVMKTITFTDLLKGSHAKSFAGSGLPRTKYKLRLRAIDRFGKSSKSVTAYFEVASSR